MHRRIVVATAIPFRLVSSPRRQLAACIDVVKRSGIDRSRSLFATGPDNRRIVGFPATSDITKQEVEETRSRLTSIYISSTTNYGAELEIITRRDFWH